MLLYVGYIQGVPPKTGHFWAVAARPVTQLPRRSSSHRMQNLQELLLRGGATRSDVFWPRYRVFSKKVGFFLQISIKLIFDIFRGLLKLHFWICRTVRNYVIFPIIILKMIHLPNSHTFFLKFWKCVTIVKNIFFSIKRMGR